MTSRADGAMDGAPTVAPARRNAVVAAVCGTAVLGVVVLSMLLSDGGVPAPTGAPAPTMSPVTSTAEESGRSLPPSSASGSGASAAPPTTTPATPIDRTTGTTGTTGTTVTSGTTATSTPSLPSSPAAPVAPVAAPATPAPAWLGTRALAPAGAGPVSPQTTPPELLDRRIVTPDVLRPPPDDRFAPVVAAVPDDVLARSTWQPTCPVVPEELRYLLVQHWGFDGRLHTGEVLVHADAVDVVVQVFAAMHAERFPLEEVRVIRADELDAAPTGDGNVTSAFVCRPSVGGGGWSGHAYGRALDVNPFHNPYERGSGGDRLVLPELATAYTDRERGLPGMLSSTSGAVAAAEDAGWGWGGRWRSAKDWMHLSEDGR